MNTELLERILDVEFHGALGDVEARGDGLIALALSDEFHHFDFA